MSLCAYISKNFAYVAFRLGITHIIKYIEHRIDLLV